MNSLLRRKFNNKKARRKWRGQLLRKQGYKCALCSQLIARVEDKCSKAWNASFDHIIPRAHGGSSKFSNLQIVHSKCNYAKGSKDGISPTKLLILIANTPKHLRIL